MVTSVKDILEELKLDSQYKAVPEKQTIALNNDEQLVLSKLSHESLHIDRISKLTTLDTSTISSILAILEIKGVIKNVGGQNYIRL
jgi:DNA processing protein